MNSPLPPDDLPPDAVPGLVGYSALEQGRRIAVPEGFAERVTTGALRQRLRRIQFQWAAGSALAASIAVAITLFASGAFHAPAVPDVVFVQPKPPTEVAPLPHTPGVREQLSEAGEALSALTRQTTEKAFAPTRSLLDSASRTTIPDPPVVPVEDPTTALAALPNAARTSLQPVTNTTRRAMNRLLKDVGFAN